MTAKLGPSGVNPGEVFRMPSGSHYRVADWSPSAEGWRCYWVSGFHDNRPVPGWNDSSWAAFNHNFLILHCWRVRG